MNKITYSFERLNIGKVERIDSVIKISQEGYKYRMAFIHFEYWNTNNDAAINLREKIENPNKEARLVYDDPWYWLLLPNNSSYKEESNKLENLKCLFENQIKRIENEVDCIYEELFQREFIPMEGKPEWLDDNSSKSFARVYPLNYKYDEIDSISSTESVNTESYDSMDYNTEIDDEIDYYYKSRYNNGEDRLHLPPPPRKWMTENICDNA